MSKSSSDSVAWICRAKSTSAASKAGGPSCSSASAMARSSGALPSRFDTALMTRISIFVSVISAAPSAILRTRSTSACMPARSHGANRVAHLGARLHDIRRDAAGVEQRVMDARVARHVLAHVVDADVHQLDRVERAAPEMRRCRGMRRAPGEGEVDPRVGERNRRRHLAEMRRMPGNGDVDVLERAVTHHERLRSAALLGGTAVVAHAARECPFRPASS